MRSCALGAPHDAVNVDFHDTTGSLGRAVNESAIFPGDATVGYKDVQSTVELSDDVVDGLFNRLSFGQRLLVTVVPDSHVGSSLSKRMSNSQADTCASARDNSCASLQREERHDSGSIRDTKVAMMECSCS
ncbi:hypothetical protein HG531_006379 [Fusarium graminearum]|nr:hypothetical protein HG531_006379 [Fusarium graminearum]